MSFKVVDIHTKEPIFDSWLEEVYKANNLRKTKKAMLLWEDGDKYYLAKMNCAPEDMDFFKANLEDYIFKVKLNDFLVDNLDKYLVCVEE